MKFLSLIFTLSFACSTSYCQNWLNGGGGAGNDDALDITKDGQAGFIISGFFSYGVDFNGTAFSSAGEIDGFVAKTDLEGNISWAKQFGGTGSDAAYANALDASGNIFVAGYYTGTMTIDGTALSSNSNSQDVFLAKLDPAGDLLWIRNFGGADHDFVYDLAVDQNGNAVITGQFKGTITVGTNVYNSIIDPEENEPSYDLFVVKYDSNGAVLWSKHGQAIYEDRGTGLAINSNNEIALIGQFSDTLTLSNTYNNHVYNTGFVMMMDADGDELWLKRMSASLCIPHDIVFHQDSLLYVTGDFTGQLGIFATPPVTTTSSFSKKIFLAKMNTQGSVLWLENDGSDSQFSSRAVEVDASGNAYVSGYFKCRLDEYSQEYGDGVFYSAGHRDVFISKYSHEGVRQWERQFGGPGDDLAWDLIISTADQPIISGAYSKFFHAPDGGLFSQTGWSTEEPLSPPNSYNLSYCGDGSYGEFATIESSGHQDILLAQPVDLSRQPYDFFHRNAGNNCQRDFLQPCINGVCLDTIQSCSLVDLEHVSVSGSNGYIGPQYNFLWSTGSTDPAINNVESGDYWLTVSRADGCYSSTDSVTVIVHPTPTQPHISDDVVINTESFNPDQIFVCYQDTLTLTLGNVDTVNNLYGWESNFGLTGTLDTIINSTGTYTAHHRNAYGCENETEILVLIDDWANADTLDPHILVGTGPNNLLDSDTLFVCEGDLIHYLTIDSSHYQTNGFSMPYFSSSWSISFPTISESLTHFDWYPDEMDDFAPWMMGHNFEATTSTRVILDVELTDHCNTDTSTYILHREFYLDVSGFSTSEFGPHSMCPGDTIEIGVNGGDFFEWTGPNYIGSDTLNSLQATGEGTFNWTASTQTPSGSFCIETDTFIVKNLDAPTITMIPAHGTICPNDSVLMTAPAGSDYVWIGPNNATVGSTQSIYATTPGFYFCQMNNPDGCFLVSNEVEVNGFNSPFIQAEPQQTICEGGVVTLTVLANENSILDWPSPLVDGVFEQDVYQAGYYEVSVNFCGLSDTVSITVFDVSPEVELNIAGFDTICAGQTLNIEGPQGYYSYEWSTGSQDTDIEVTEAGEYFLSAENFEGCIGHSDTLYVEILPAPEPPLLSDTTVCHLGSAVSEVLGSQDPVHWFNSTLDSLGFFPQLQTDSVASLTEFYGAHFNGECFSLLDTASIQVYAGSQPPVISGTIVLCQNDSLVLTTSGPSLVTNAWLLPDLTTVIGDSINIANPDSGVYTLIAQHQYCATDSTEETVTIIEGGNYPIEFLNGDSLNCLGDTVLLGFSNVFSSIEWGPNEATTDSIMVLENSETWATIVDSSGCIIQTDTIPVAFNIPPAAVSLNSDTVCLGESTEISINTSDILNLSDGIDTTEFVNPFETELLFTDTVYSFLLSDSIGCFSEPIAWNIEVIQTPGTLEISGDSLLCEGDELVLTASPADNGLITFLDLSSDTLGIANSGGQLTLSAVGIGDIYQSVLAQLYMDGCTIQSTALEVEVLPIPAQPELIQIGNGCPNDTVLIYAADSAGLAHYWAGPNNFSSNNQVISFEPIEHDQQGTYTLFVQQSICQSETASINIQIAPEPEVSLPADTVICLGDIIDLNTNEFFDEVVWSTGEVSEVISVEDSGYYWVLVHNEFDCQDSDSILVETTVCDVAVGNAFTPNNDGINDLFKLNSEGLQEIEVKIFNRFGRLIYRWETLDGAWDGTIQNNSFDAQEGTYFFVGNYLDISGEAGTKKGYIQLTR